jgi:hypothetical protein
MYDIKFLKKEKDGRVVFGLSDVNDVVSGATLLAQVVMAQLLTEVGSSVLNPNMGGSLSKKPRQIYTTDALVASVIQAVTKVEDDIIKEQELADFPDDERLNALIVEKIEIKNPTEISVILQIVTDSSKAIKIAI